MLAAPGGGLRVCGDHLLAGAVCGAGGGRARGFSAPRRTAVIDTSSGWPVAIAYSLVLLATAIVLIVLEFLGRQGAARIGAALITLLVILRMADADMSLFVKGLAFIVIGSCFLGFNIFISRRRLTLPAGTLE